MLIRPNKAEAAVHGCHCPGDMAVRMRKVLARSWVGVQVCHLLLLLFYYVSNYADSQMEVPRYRSSPTSWDDVFFSVYSAAVLGKNASIRSKLPTAACWSREEKRRRCEANLLYFEATLVPQTNHSQYSSPTGALNLIVESKSLPVELNNSTIELHVPSRRKKRFWFPCLMHLIWPLMSRWVSTLQLNLR